LKDGKVPCRLLFDSSIPFNDKLAITFGIVPSLETEQEKITRLNFPQHANRTTKKPHTDDYFQRRNSVNLAEKLVATCQ
jgi:hypothetical protein